MVWRIATATWVLMVGCSGQLANSSRKIPETDVVATGGVFDLEGRPFDVCRDPQVRATVIIFVRSDCPISNRMAPEIGRLYARYQPQGAAFYLIYVDPAEAPDAIREHLREYAYPCQGLRDPRHQLVKRTGATVTPEAVVLDRGKRMVYRGRINDRYTDLGRSRAEATRQDLAEALEAVLQGRPAAEPVTKAVGCLIEDLETE